MTNEEVIEKFKEEILEEINNIKKNYNKSTFIINAFAGAGAGKTTYCLSIAEKLKKEGYVAEYVQEYAKELVWDEKFDLLDGSLENQFKILKEQLSRINRLYGKVDFIVTDAPILLNELYHNELTDSYKNMLEEIHKAYYNYNFFVIRDKSKFEKEGRLQNLKESIEKDKEIKEILKNHQIGYKQKDIDKEYEIIDDVKKFLENNKKFIENLKPRFTQEEYEKAAAVNLFDYLNQNGYNLKKKGRDYCLEEHDSLYITPGNNTWYWHSQNKGGSIIQFLQEYEGKSLVEAIYTLNNKSTIEQRAYTRYEPINAKDEKGELILPTKNEDSRRVQAYLSKTRGLDFEIVNSLMKQGLIYESADKHEVVFLSKDKDDNVKYASKRSTLLNSSFRQDITNSNKEFGFKTVGTSERVFVFEAPIDLISHCTLAKMQGKNWKEDNRISLGGVSDVALKKFLEEYPNVKEIILFLDNDKAGIENAQKIYKKYANEYKVNIFTTKYKDLNETLIKFKEEKLKNENTKIKDYVVSVEKPFIEPKLQDKEILRNYLEKIIDENYVGEEKDIIINNIIDNNILAISKDNKGILFIKNENGENIGGYEFDIYNKDYENLKLIENSPNIPTLMGYAEDKDYCIVMDNFIGSIYMSQSGLSNIAYIDNFKDITRIETIIEKKSFNQIAFCLDRKSEKEGNFLKELNYLKEKYPDIKITSSEEDFSDFCEIIKEEYRKPKEVEEIEEIEEMEM